MTGIKKNSEQLRKAVEAGINPSTVTLEDGVNVIKGIIVDHKLVFFILFFGYGTSNFSHAIFFSILLLILK